MVEREFEDEFMIMNDSRQGEGEAACEAVIDITFEASGDRDLHYHIFGKKRLGSGHAMFGGKLLAELSFPDQRRRLQKRGDEIERQGALRFLTK